MTQAEAGQDNANAPRTGRWQRIALILSLALNVLFLGAVVGAGWMYWHDGPGHRRFSFSRGVEQLIQEMPADRKPIGRVILKRYEADVRPRWKEVGEARRQAFEALRAEPFNESRAQQSFERMNEIREVQLERMGRLTFELMRQLTPGERRIFLQALRRPRKPPPREDARSDAASRAQRQ